ncbi:MAG: DUF1905 domain-containing protein [Candidatus Doudnabacteria bacterium]|nr:DUF1905 domain-containing protein [Candidatus Doudnabacteria bacterium]
MDLEFTGEIFYWRGPAPFFFVTIPEEQSAKIKAISSMVTYGWGVIPVTARINETEFKTSLFPKDGKYLLPLKVAIRKAENLEVGESISVQLEIPL